MNWKVSTKKKKAHFFSVHIKLYYLIIIIIIINNNNNSHYFTTQVINTTIHHLQNSISCCVVMAELECSGHMTRQGFGKATVPSHKYSNTDREQLFNNSVTHDVLT